MSLKQNLSVFAESAENMQKFNKGDIVRITKQGRKKTLGLDLGVVSSVKHSETVPIYRIIIPALNGMKFKAHLLEKDLILAEV